MKSITITSYNIHKGMSPTNRLVRLMGMKDALLKPILIFYVCRRCKGKISNARLILLNFLTVGNMNGLASFGRCIKLWQNAEYEHGHHGNAVLSRHPLDPKHNLNITVNRLEKEVCFIVRCIQMAGGVLWLCCVAI